MRYTNTRVLYFISEVDIHMQTSDDYQTLFLAQERKKFENFAVIQARGRMTMTSLVDCMHKNYK